MGILISSVLNSQELASHLFVVFHIIEQQANSSHPLTCSFKHSILFFAHLIIKQSIAIIDQFCVIFDLHLTMPPKRYFSKPKRNYSLNDDNQKQKNRVQISSLLVGQEKVGLEIPYRIISSDYELKNIIKNKGGKWDPQDKLWVLSAQEYTNNLPTLLQYCKQKGYFLSTIPQFAYQLVRPMPLELQIKIHRFHCSAMIEYSEIQTFIDPDSLPFYDKLYEFQRESLRFGISKHGRILLADEMGVGKTIQSLAIAYIYRNEWPLLIICPSTLRYNWQNQILKWYSSQIKKSEVQVYSKGGTTLKDSTKILIISYELAWKFKDLIIDFKVAIADEAHYLKNSGCKRSDILVPLLAEKRRVILLTGTPAFARPRQIFNLASIIRPDIFNNFKQFGNRYCDPQRNPWSSMIEYNGCKNSKQLFFLLKNRIMLRRLKKDVLSQLPDKQRQKILIQTNKNICKEISGLISEHSTSPTAEDLIMEMFGIKSNMQNDRKERETIMEAYRLTGLAKVDGAVQYILALLQNDIKILVFAHHQVMLDSIQQSLKKKKYKSIRVDGNVEMSERQDRVDKFQSDQSIKIALLSISAAGVGLTLTASNTVIFAQLHWTPGMLIQAQDRAHRIGQKDCVNCHYLIGQNTLDPILYNYLLKKISNVSSFVDGEQSNLHIEQLKKGEHGKFSKKNIIEEEVRNSSGKKTSQFHMITPIRKQYQIDAISPEEQQDLQHQPQRICIQNIESMTQWTDISSQTKIDNDNETVSIKSRKKLLPVSKIEQDQKQYQQQKGEHDTSYETLRTSDLFRRLSEGCFSSMKKNPQTSNEKQSKENVQDNQFS